MTEDADLLAVREERGERSWLTASSQAGQRAGQPAQQSRYDHRLANASFQVFRLTSPERLQMLVLVIEPVASDP